jgi:hypothetical protein
MRGLRAAIALSVALVVGALTLLAGPAAAVQPSPDKMQTWSSRQRVVERIADLDEIYNRQIADFMAGLDTSDTAELGSNRVDRIRRRLTRSPDKRLNKVMNKALDEVGDLFDKDFFRIEPSEPEAVAEMHVVAVAWENVKARLVAYGIVGPDTQWSLLTASVLPEPAPPPSVTYDLTGQGSVSVTLQNASGGTEQFDTPLPYHLDLGPVSGFVYISAQLENRGTVTCEIKVGGEVRETATSSGQYVIAACSGYV